MPEPVFTENDRVTTTVELPAEIRNETDPRKIAAYYQRREGALREELRRNPPSTRVTMTRETDDQRREERHSEPAVLSVEEATSARETLIATARQTARQGKPYWDRLAADIEKLMAEQSPENRINVQIWELSYNSLLGMNMDRLLREDRDKAAAEATRLAAERAQPATEQGVAPPPLPVEVTSKVLPGLGINEEQYRTAQDNMLTGKWPLTSENINGKRIRIGERS